MEIFALTDAQLELCDQEVVRQYLQGSADALGARVEWAYATETQVIMEVSFPSGSIKNRTAVIHGLSSLLGALHSTTLDELAEQALGSGMQKCFGVVFFLFLNMLDVSCSA